MTTEPKTSEAETVAINLDARQVGNELFDEVLHDSLSSLASLSYIRNEDEADGNKGVLQVHTVGELSVVRLGRKNLTYVRGRKQISVGDLDDYYGMGICSKGRVYAATDRSFVIEPGDCILYDLAQPFSGHFTTESDAYTIIIPKPVLHQIGFSLKGKADCFLSGATPMGAMLNGAILNMGANLSQATPEQKLALSNTLPAMIRHLMMPGANSKDSPTVRSATLAAVMEYIDNHLHEPGLGVDAIVKALHSSRSVVYRLFAEEGGIAAYIQRRRLYACYRELVLETNPEKRIIDIAVNWGFSNHSHFTRLFRENYDITPSSLRDAVMARTGERQAASGDLRQTNR